MTGGANFIYNFKLKNDQEYNESDLVTSLTKGDILAFNDLFRTYSGRLYRFAYSYLKSGDEAEELVQEVFTKIWEKRRQLKGDLCFKSYLFTIAFNIIKKHFRAKATAMKYFKSSLSDDINDNTSEEEINYKSLSQYIDNVINTLPERRKEIFIRSRFKGQSIEEISRDLNISHKTVENQITKTLKTLRDQLVKEGLTGLLFFCLFLF